MSWYWGKVLCSTWGGLVSDHASSCQLIVGRLRGIHLFLKGFQAPDAVKVQVCENRIVETQKNQHVE